MGRARAQRRWDSFRQADLYPTVYIRPSEMLPWAPTWLAPAGSRRRCQGQTWTPSPPPHRQAPSSLQGTCPFLPRKEEEEEASAQLRLHPAPGDVTRALANTNTPEAPPVARSQARSGPRGAAV